MPGGPTIAQILLDELRDRVRSQSSSTPIELAIRAAAEPTPERRAWALVDLAARLREVGERENAMLAINGAVALDAGDDVTRAAYTCAVALHADSDDLTTAVKLGEELLAEGHSTYLLRAMARVYWELWESTKEETWRLRWSRTNAALGGDVAQSA